MATTIAPIPMPDNATAIQQFQLIRLNYVANQLAQLQAMLERKESQETRRRFELLNRATASLFKACLDEGVGHWANEILTRYCLPTRQQSPN